MAKRITAALLLSAILHLIIIWFTQPLFEGDIIPFQSRTILKVSLKRTVQASEASSNQNQIPPLVNSESTTPEPAEITSNSQAEPAHQQKKQSNTKKDKIRPITTAKIYSSAAAITHDLSANQNEQDTDNKKSEVDSVSTILDRALNPPRKVPQITTLSDGTTKVVTKQGYTYCIKALEDWKILGPEDDMRVSVYCE